MVSPQEANVRHLEFFNNFFFLLREVKDSDHAFIVWKFEYTMGKLLRIRIFVSAFWPWEVKWIEEKTQMYACHESNLSCIEKKIQSKFNRGIHSINWCWRIKASKCKC